MSHHKRVSSEKDPLFPFCWELYQTAFPEVERRAKDYHTESMALDLFHADVVFDSDTPIGILFWWELSNFRFIEHFATSPTLRGKGYGDKILRGLIAQNDKPILLEVEHPTDDISRRRIGFYERIGFTLNKHPYSHPSYQQLPNTFVSLMVMTYPRPLSTEELQRFTEVEFPTLHFRSYR